MELIKLETTNFKRLGTGVFNFTKGLNFISGDNGQGKSTLLRAVATTMFGISMLPGHSDDVTTWGFDRWNLELTLKNGEDSYLVKRSKSTASVEKNGELVANGNTPVTKYMEDLLGISAKDYNLLIHSRQKETGYVLSYGATALQRKVEEFAGVEVVEQVEKLASGRASEAKMRLEALVQPEMPEEDLEVLKTQRDKIFFQLTDVIEREAPTPPSVSVRAAAKKLQDYKDSLAALVEFGNRKEDLEQQLSELVEVKEPVEPTEIKGRIAEVKDLIKEIESHNSSVDAGVTKKSLLEQQLAKLNKEAPTEELKSFDSSVLESLIEHRVELRSKIKDVTQHLQEGKCDSCGTVLHEIDPAALSKQIEELKTELEETVEAIEFQESEKTRLGKIQISWDAFNLEQVEKDKLKQQISESIIPSKKDATDLTSELEQLTGSLASYQSEFQRYTDYVQAREALKSRLLRLTAPEVLPEVKESYVDSIEAEWEEHQKKVSAYENVELQKAKLQSDLSLLESKIKGVEAIISKIEKFESQKLELTEKLETASSLSRYLRSKRADYLAQVWDGIMHYASNFLNQATSGWLTEVGVKDSKFLFKQEGAWVPAVEASGAQEAFVGAALRYGLNKALYRGKTFLVFDEPTEAMTEENARNLVAALGTASDQVLLVTHKSTDQALADNIIEI